MVASSTRGTDSSIASMRGASVASRQRVQVTGYPPSSNGLSSPEALVLSSTQMPPKPASLITVQRQLDSRADVPTTACSQS